MSNPLEKICCPVCATPIAEHDDLIWVVQGEIVCSQKCAQYKAHPPVITAIHSPPRV